MSDDFSSQTGGIALQAPRSPTAFELTSDDEELIETLDAQVIQSTEEPDSLSALAVRNSRQLEHSRVVIDSKAESYRLSMYDKSLDTYTRDFISRVFINGVPVDVQSDGLELEEVTVFVYLTTEEEYVVSIWT